MNAALQCLKFNESFCAFWNKSGKKLAQAIFRWIQEPPSAAVYSPDDILRALGRVAPQFASYDQQDSHEFLRVTLQSLEGIPAAELFRGQMTSSVFCEICKKTSCVVEDFLDLSLSIGDSSWLARPISLEQCLKEFSNEESITALCETCKRQTPSRKKLRISKYPELLCLHLKRFTAHGGWFQGPAKNSKTVLFDFYLQPDQAEDVNYQLWGIIQHSGSMSGGHYVAFCRKNDWWLCDDTRVSLTTKTKSAEPYLLFYQKIREPDVQVDWNRVQSVKSESLVYVNKSWLRKLQLLSHPGPLPKPILCIHAKLGNVDPLEFLSPLQKCLAEDFALKYSAIDNTGFLEAPLEVCQKCADRFLLDKKRRNIEKLLISRFDSLKDSPGLWWYWVEMSWVNKWRIYVEESRMPENQAFDGVIKDDPGPMNNQILIGKISEANKDYLLVNKTVFALFLYFHGGGPILRSHGLIEKNTPEILEEIESDAIPLTTQQEIQGLSANDFLLA